MERDVLQLGRRHAVHLAVALAMIVATIPVVLGALAEPSAAATTPGNTAISTQQVVADAECDAAWLEMDVKYFLVTAGTPITPSCAPVPAAFQDSISTVLYNYCLFTLEADGGHGICVPPATTPNN